MRFDSIFETLDSFFIDNVVSPSTKVTPSVRTIRKIKKPLIQEHETSLVDYRPVKGKYRLGSKSIEKLSYAHPDIREVVELAITLSTVDFAVFEVLRSYKTQRSYVKRGVSKTMNTYHFYGIAVDLVAYVNGKLTWNKKYYKAIAKAMHKAMKILGYVGRIINGYEKWGWDNPHWQLARIKRYGSNPRKYFKNHKYIGF